jgi:predicted MPP superfamily phosphohydrolase
MPLWRLLLFFVLVTFVTAAWHGYLWARLVRDPALGDPWTRILTWLFVALFCLVPIGMIAARTLPRTVHGPLAWVVFGWMGLGFVLLFTLIPVDVVRAVALRARPVDPERRQALARILAAGVGLVGAGLSGFGVAQALSRVGVKKVSVPLAKLPPELSGYVIVQLTDVHVGPTIGREFLEEIVATVNAESPDLVVITGDLVDGSVAELGPLMAPLAELRAKDGVFFVTGNHEYYSGVDEWLAFLPTLGIRPLRNERVSLREGAAGGGLDLAGVDDHSAHRFGGGHGTDLEKALSGRDTSRAVVLLAHQPKTFLRAVEHGIDLQLSGHTHGGQIWPWGYAVRLDQPHVAGLSKEGASYIYVSRGTGYWGPPMRVGAPAEVTRIELGASA